MILDRLNSRKFNIQHLEIEIRTLRVVIKFSLMEEGGAVDFEKLQLFQSFEKRKILKGSYSPLITARVETTRCSPRVAWFGQELHSH